VAQPALAVMGYACGHLPEWAADPPILRVGPQRRSHEVGNLTVADASVFQTAQRLSPRLGDPPTPSRLSDSPERGLESDRLTVPFRVVRQDLAEVIVHWARAGDNGSRAACWPRRQLAVPCSARQDCLVAV